MAHRDGRRLRARRLVGWLIAACLTASVDMTASPAAAQQKTATEVLGAVFKVDVRVPDDARTAETLGAVRAGHGALIDSDGHILTIGYIVLEADEIRLTDSEGRVTPATLVAYDHNTGFGLLRALGPLSAKPLQLGNSDAMHVSQVALAASSGGRDGALPVQVVSRRTYTGYWEYMLNRAIFTVPPIPTFAGAGLLDAEGQLVGIGSLVVENAAGNDQYSPGNMFVPINAVKPILADMLEGRRAGPNHPWIGIYTEELRGRLFVQRVARDGPAALAGIAANELIVAVGGQPIRGQADFYHKLWALGGPGTPVPLRLLTHDGRLRDVTLNSVDRYSWLKLPRGN